MTTHDKTNSERSSVLEPTFGPDGPQPRSSSVGHQSDEPGVSSANGLLDGIQDRIGASAAQQKDRAAEGLGGVAQAFHLAGDELRATNETVASYVDMAGNSLRRMADHVRDHGVSEMMGDLQQFARRRPGLFIGGAFLVGVGLARFLKSSPAPHASVNDDGDQVGARHWPPPVPPSSSMGEVHVRGPVL